MVVDDGLFFCELSVGRYNFADAVASMLGRERHHGRCAAMSGGYGGRIEIVGIQKSERRDLLDMAMAIDAPGQNEFAGRIDIPCPRWQGRRDLSDQAILDADILTRLLFGRDDRAASDGEIEFAHGCETVPKSDNAVCRGNPDTRPPPLNIP